MTNLVKDQELSLNSYIPDLSEPRKREKTGGGMGFQVVSLSPTKKQMIDRNLIKHFKAVQEAEYQSWKGLNVKFTSRPGLGDSLNQTGLGA